MVHELAALALTAAMAGGIVGLGGALAGSTLADRVVRGWTVLWWSIALAAQLLTPRVAVGVGVVVAAAGLVVLAREARRVRARTVTAGLLAVMAGAPLWLLPPVFYDALVYHLGLPWSWLANGSFAPVAHNLFTHFPLAASTVYLVPVGLGLPEAAAGLQWFVFLAVLSSLVLLARNLGAGRWSWLAALLLAVCWHAVWMGAVASADHLVLLGTLAALERVTASRTPTPNGIASAGFALGLAAAAKYTAFPPVLAVLVAASIVWPLRGVVSSAAVAVASSSFWWIRNLVTVGNPFYPLLWGILGGRGWTAGDEARFSALVHEGGGGMVGVARGLVHLVVPPDGLGWWLVLALPVVAAALAATGPLRRQRWAMATFVVVAAVAWLLTSQTTRYALPLGAAVAALAAAGVATSSARLRRWLAAALVLAAAAEAVALAGFFFGVLGVHQVWLGRVSAEVWRHAVTIDDPLPGYRACARLLPADARILVVAEGRPWGCPRPHHVSSPYDSQLVQAIVESSSDAHEAAARLRAAGFTHLFINWAEARRLGGDDYRVLRFDSSRGEVVWRELLTACTAPVYREGGLEVRTLSVCSAFGGGS
jgi:hypothetical protein